MCVTSSDPSFFFIGFIALPFPSRMARLRARSSRDACQTGFVKSGIVGNDSRTASPLPSPSWQRMQAER